MTITLSSGPGGHFGHSDESPSAEADPAGISGLGFQGWDFRARWCSRESGRSWGTEPLALMALLHLFYLQVESELHRKHVREAWGDQLTQKTKVWGVALVFWSLGGL